MTELARKVGFTREYVSQVVHGRRRASVVEMRIARVLGMESRTGMIHRGYRPIAPSRDGKGEGK